MSIQSEINRINTSVAAAYTALGEVGATLPTTRNVDNLASTALTISSNTTSGLTSELVWTNASPTSEFAAQTISIDLSGVDDVEIYYQEGTDSGARYYTKIHVGSAGRLAATYGNYLTRRYANVTTTGIDWTIGQRMNTYPSAWAEVNKVLVPVAIYAIKGVTK